MPFSTTASIVSTDLDNMLRGTNRDNSDTAVTGTTTETTLKSYTLGANVLGATGGLHVIVAGTNAGTAGTKTKNLKFGGTTISSIANGAAFTGPWSFDAWIFNTATNAQRILARRSDDNQNVIESYTTTAIDTTASQVISVTGTLGNSGDTTTATMWDIFIVQIQ